MMSTRLHGHAVQRQGLARHHEDHEDFQTAYGFELAASPSQQDISLSLASARPP